MANKEEVHNASTQMSKRLKLREREKWIIEDYFPSGAMHMIAGASGMGKTTWLLQLLHDWEAGRDVLGKRSFPCNWMYLSADRGLLETDRTLRRIGLGEWNCPIFSIEDVYRSFQSPDLISVCQKFPDIDLFVVEGLQSFIPDAPKGRSQNKSDQLWMAKLRSEVLIPKHKTIIGTTQAGKAAEQYVQARSQMLGTASFIGSCSTVVVFDLPNDVKDASKNGNTVRSDIRQVKILGRDFHDVQLTYARDEHGRLELFDELVSDLIAQTDDEAGSKRGGRVELEIVMARALRQVGSEGAKAKKFEEIAASAGWSRASVFRWLAEGVAKGVIEKGDKGEYRAVRVN